MDLESFRRELDEWWVENDARQMAQKNSQRALLALVSLYESFKPAERVLANEVISDWVGSDNERKRFDALAMIDQFRIAVARSALQRFEVELLARKDHEAPYELAKIKRLRHGLPPRRGPIAGLTDYWSSLLKERTMKLELTEDQALVLFEWLSRLDEQDAFPCEDESEEFVLWALHGQLEKLLAAQFDPGYRQLIAKARERVKTSQEAGRERG